MNSNKNFKSGFTLIELLVVVSIIGILASVVLVALNNAKNKGADAGVKTNLRNAISQGEILYNTRTANKNTYTDACTDGLVDGANGVGSFVLAAAKASGLSSYGINNVPPASTTVATCNDSPDAWAAEVPLKTAGQVWCVDSTGKSKQEAVSIGAGTVCA
ncbi:hypothetical protein A2917_02180 [Candidatus Nomurabacteria bacterium RIFCSPLOWO2_01_FULL_42_17]|uniref:Type II secretion system protein GspG C-terminal domain-containing protein n=1 Tax=Candidatus Nomurabacteria bacterium RIFCSPLOWO2_01_FULL_42_17 TaxID=1801780 RepID=A0A1F6XMR9_9BACT|nr:MAG: hypothetical protein A2917_02180 [Candidatus Nomurabacteria bacterium RIFCSPLOWO2_01_FULL_42_17]